jgi:hypothetical protein
MHGFRSINNNYYGHGSGRDLHVLLSQEFRYGKSRQLSKKECSISTGRMCKPVPRSVSCVTESRIQDMVHGRNTLALERTARKGMTRTFSGAAATSMGVSRRAMEVWSNTEGATVTVHDSRPRVDVTKLGSASKNYDPTMRLENAPFVVAATPMSLAQEANQRVRDATLGSSWQPRGTLDPELELSQRRRVLCEGFK